MADSVFKVVLNHYLFDMGLSIMFENIKANMHISKPNTHGFHGLQPFPFDCDILVKIPCNDYAEWIDDLVCTGCDETTYYFDSCKFPMDWIIKIMKHDEFTDDGYDEYKNPKYREIYTDIDGTVKYCDDDSKVDLDEFDLISDNESEESED